MKSPPSTVAFRGQSEVGLGGIGWFARLSCDGERLRLRALSTYEFVPEQVVDIETFTLIPLLSVGLRIRHNRLDYPERVLFRRMGSARHVAEGIRDTGFTPAGKAIVRPRRRLGWALIAAWIALPIAFGLMIFLHAR